DHHNCLTVEGIRTAMKYDVTFILGSDAHVPQNVGMVERALARAEQAGLDLSRIVNYRRD
ncbi:MAG: phosphoesterase, partial [Firmicutes bacterium]|nr:phosphoesterase [Bacillota bacterium]